MSSSHHFSLYCVFNNIMAIVCALTAAKKAFRECHSVWFTYEYSSLQTEKGSAVHHSHFDPSSPLSQRENVINGKIILGLPKKLTQRLLFSNIGLILHRRRSHLEEIFVTSCLLDKTSIIVTPSTSVVDFFTITNYPICWLSVSCLSCFPIQKK